MRGKVPAFRQSLFLCRITPAYAGKRPADQAFCQRRKDHPRLCGEKKHVCGFWRRFVGSPPPMRGKAENFPVQSGWQGITPAYAGKSAKYGIPESELQDHPRLCGEKVVAINGEKSVTGSPPPMRGKGKSRWEGTRVVGITPAYAGKSASPPQKWHGFRDHPRLCGEKSTGQNFLMRHLGSPPPMRGKAKKRKSRHDRARITPAYAGKSQPVRIF